ADGMCVTDAGTRYKMLVLPDCRLIPHETLAKVLELARCGATVVFLGRYPDDVPGFARLESRRKTLGRFLRQLPAADFGRSAEHAFGRGRILTGCDLAELLAAAGATREPLKEAGCQLIRQSSDAGKRYFLWLTRGPALDGWYEIGAAARQVVVADPLTGRRGLAASRSTACGTTEVYLQLQPGESLLLETRMQSCGGDVPVWRYAERFGEGIEGRDWELSFPDAEPAVDSVFRLDGPCSWTDLSPELAVFCGTGRYAARFTVPDPAAADEWVLDLGGLCESARVRINGHDAGIVWAVPFRLEVGRWLVAGDNLFEIEVTNLPANRIADYDRRGIQWRKFKDANIVSALNKPLDTSAWAPEPSGLNGAVKLYPVTTKTIR
ncbi:MAG: glycosyl hydrolase family 2, partial [Alistipes sp.]|nr:glycosyl hydrolase family 2 [Alistipes sp.]